MNKRRRNRLGELCSTLLSLSEELRAIIDEEQEYMDNMPENLQGGERYMRTEEVVDALIDAEANIDEAVRLIDESKD